MSYFLLSPSNLKSVAVACAPSNSPASYILADEVLISSKMPFNLKLKNISFSKDGATESDILGNIKHLWLDYQPNSLAWPIFSSRLKNIIETSLTGKEDIEWIDVAIESGLDGDSPQGYHLLVFKSQIDILNTEKSIFSGRNKDFLVNPAFLKNEAQKLSIFCLPDQFPQIATQIYVSQSIKLLCKNIIGLSFEEISLY